MSAAVFIRPGKAVILPERLVIFVFVSWGALTAAFDLIQVPQMLSLRLLTGILAPVFGFRLRLASHTSGDAGFWQCVSRPCVGVLCFRIPSVFCAKHRLFLRLDAISFGLFGRRLRTWRFLCAARLPASRQPQRPLPLSAEALCGGALFRVFSCQRILFYLIRVDPKERRE